MQKNENIDQVSNWSIKYICDNKLLKSPIWFVAIAAIEVFWMPKSVYIYMNTNVNKTMNLWIGNQWDCTRSQNEH